ncbi:threonylcarbamoyl-AMP synthase [bacterium]|nr:threonylcarbamoyl-AMP synthase [bacterium]
MGKPLVAVVLGTRADFNVMKRSLESLRVMGVPYVFEMASAWKTPDRLARFATGAIDQGIEVIICASGGSAAIAGVIASHTTLPVIAIPIDATPLRGQDALYSLVQSPPGHPVAVVGINNSENAVLLATQILANKYPRFRQVLHHARTVAAQKIEATWKELANEYPDLCQVEKTAPNLGRGTASDRETDPGDDVTPAPDQPTALNPDRIRPGATLGRPNPLPRIDAEALVATPEPQEPGNQTEDRTPDFEDNKTNVRPIPDFPPPPRLSDLTPLAVPERPIRVQDTPLDVERISPPTPFDKAINLAEAYVDTKVFQIKHDDPDEDVLAHAMMVLLEGGIVAFPTDTVYGLAADATNASAVKRLYETKGHEASRKSLSVLIHSQDLLETLVREVPASIESVLEKHWPGGLSVLFYKHPNVLPTVSESPSIAVRIPNDPLALKVLELVGRPLVVINASLGSSPAAVDARHVLDRFEGKINCVLDAGPCKTGSTSTVLSVLSEPFEILRDGAVPASDIRKILGGRLKE